MPREDFRISASEYAAGVGTAMDNLAQHLPYNEIAHASMMAIGRGNEDAVSVPAVRFLLDAALGVLSVPSVQERLPKEIVYRRAIAEKCAVHAAYSSVHKDRLANFYANNVYLGAHTYSWQSNPDFLADLAKTTFQDVGIVAGGSLRATRRHEVSQAPADVIARSKGLLAAAGISRYKAKKAANFLGVPYAHTKHFRVHEDDQPRVSFTPHALDQLKQFYGDGCPASDVIVGNPARTALHDGWEEIVRYLVPEGATTNFKAGKYRVAIE